MTSEHPTYPERTADDERRNALLQMQIYEAIVIAANDAHAVIDIMLTASDPDAAHQALVDRYDLSEVQAWAVMDIQFRRLTSIDRQKVEQRHREVRELVAAVDRELGQT